MRAVSPQRHGMVYPAGRKTWKDAICSLKTGERGRESAAEIQKRYEIFKSIFRSISEQNVKSFCFPATPEIKPKPSPLENDDRTSLKWLQVEICQVAGTICCLSMGVILMNRTSLDFLAGETWIWKITLKFASFERAKENRVKNQSDFRKLEILLCVEQS